MVREYTRVTGSARLIVTIQRQCCQVQVVHNQSRYTPHRSPEYDRSDPTPSGTHRARYWRCCPSSVPRSRSCPCRWRAATRTPRRARCPSRTDRRRRRCRRGSRPSTRPLRRPPAKRTVLAVARSHPVKGNVSHFRMLIQLRVKKLTVFSLAGKAATA